MKPAINFLTDKDLKILQIMRTFIPNLRRVNIKGTFALPRTLNNKCKCSILEPDTIYLPRQLSNYPNIKIINIWSKVFKTVFKDVNLARCMNYINNGENKTVQIYAFQISVRPNTPSANLINILRS